jgi:cbb3-type cytochrome oxidase maturation protein
MTSIGFLLPIALLLGLGGLAAFLWSVKNGQYDDLDGAAERILSDDPPDDPTC